MGTATFNQPVDLLGSLCLLPLAMHGEILHFFLLQQRQTPNEGRVSRHQWALVPKGHTCIKATWEAQEMVLGVFLGWIDECPYVWGWIHALALWLC